MTTGGIRRSADIEASETLRQPGDVFVGRTSLLETLRTAFQRGRVAVVDAWGIPGSGKSTLLAHAQTGLASPSDLALRYRFSAEEVPDADPDEQAIADYGAFQAFAGRLADEVRQILDPPADSREARLLGDFALAYDEARVSGGAINAKATVLFSIVRDSNVSSVSAATLHTSVREKRPRLAAALTRLLRGLTQEAPQAEARRMLLALDEFEAVPNSPLKTWVLELIRDLDSALVLVPRTPNLAPPDAGGVAVNCPLGRLSRDEIRDFANECLPLEISDELVQVIENATDGHPQAVSLAVELLQRYEEPEADTLAAELETLPTDLAQKHSQMVEKILGRDGARAEATLRACAVMRKFDAKMLAAVVGADADLEQLKRYSFIEEAPDPRDGFLRIHPVVRRELAHRLEHSDNARFLDLHRSAADHCASWLSEFEEEEGVDPESSSYGSWYRYEDPGWQAAKREWLFHQAHASSSGKDERELGRLRFCRVFFDAFWWWGCYLDFSFCRDLLRDWRSTQEDREWTDALDVVLSAYPGGYEKDQAPTAWREGELPRWDAIRAALLDVLKASGLDGDPHALPDGDARHTRALVDTFLAHAARYRAADTDAYTKAVEHYDAAVSLFELDKDGWDTAWTRFERGELHLEHEHEDAARKDWNAAAQLAPGLADEELAANLHRLAADAHAAAGRTEAAFAAHGRAVLHAYLFQRRPHPPDEYTLSFYGEQVARALDRFVQHARDGGDVARAAELLCAPFPGESAPPAEQVDALCREPDLAALATALFPAPPSVDELNRRSSKFVQRWLLAEADLQPSAPTDLAQSVW